MIKIFFCLSQKAKKKKDMNKNFYFYLNNLDKVFINIIHSIKLYLINFKLKKNYVYHITYLHLYKINKKINKKKLHFNLTVFIPNTITITQPAFGHAFQQTRLDEQTFVWRRLFFLLYYIG